MFYTKYFAKTIGSNFMQIFFHNKYYKYFLQKLFQNKIDRKYKFFSSESLVDGTTMTFSYLKVVVFVIEEHTCSLNLFLKVMNSSLVRSAKWLMANLSCLWAALLKASM